jgi:hypothetical protein
MKSLLQNQIDFLNRTISDKRTHIMLSKKTDEVLINQLEKNGN